MKDAHTIGVSFRIETVVEQAVSQASRKSRDGFALAILFRPAVPLLTLPP
jgi:hypothetical protein